MRIIDNLKLFCQQPIIIHNAVNLFPMNAPHKDKVRQAFAERFRKALKELGYYPNNQQALGHLFGVSGQAARKWAYGSALPTAARLPHIAEILGVRRAWLMDGEGSMHPTTFKVAEGGPSSKGKSDDSDMSISVEEIRLIQEYRSLTAKQREAIRYFVALLREG